MSLGIAHFAVGAAGTALVLTLVAPRIRFRGTIIVLGGVWALLPGIATHSAHPWFIEFHRSPAADLFWFHRTMQVHDPFQRPWLAIVSVLVLLVAVGLSDWRDGGGIRLNNQAQAVKADDPEDGRWPDR